jgi:3-hydroxyacyl-CoA dehydrogenase/enoyl-CoA hydratase/3-hydroxybutyryl-CoA epimerase
MSFIHFTLDVDSDGLALVTWNSPGRSMNVLDAAVLDELSAIVEQIAADAAIKGVVITSGKDSFCVGADLTMLENLSRAHAELVTSQGETAANERVFEESRKTSLLYRRIETCGKPWVAAINGIAVGGGFELTLACHHRVASDNDKTRLGLPEIKVGLFPGAGGTQRVARILPAADALNFLLKGDQISASRAKTMKLVDEVVPAGDLVKAAKAWIITRGTA